MELQPRKFASLEFLGEETVATVPSLWIDKDMVRLQHFNTYLKSLTYFGNFPLHNLQLNTFGIKPRFTLLFEVSTA